LELSQNSGEPYNVLLPETGRVVAWPSGLKAGESQLIVSYAVLMET